MKTTKPLAAMVATVEDRPEQPGRPAWAGRCGSLVLALVVAALLAGVSGSLGAGSRPADLPERYQKWLDDVAIIIDKKERKAFLALDEDYQRDAFVRRFWASRDPDPETPDNKFKSQYLARLDEARARFAVAGDDRVAVYVLNGEPASVYETDCGLLLWPLEIWRYRYSEHSGGNLLLVFYQRGVAGPFRLWSPRDSHEILVQVPSTKTFYQLVKDDCLESADEVAQLLQTLRIYEDVGDLQISAATAPPHPDPEWLSGFHAFSTEIDARAKQFQAALALEYPGVHKQRVILRGVLSVPAAEAVAVDLAGRRSYNFALTGEVLAAAELFESFKYVFDVPENEATGGAVALVFERWLRPGTYRLVLKLEDIHGGSVSRVAEEITVPELSALGGRAPDGASGAAPSAAAAAPARTTLELVAEGKDLQRGYARFAARVDGTDVAKVRFFLEDRPILTKTRPPYSVELDLGTLPDTMTVRAVALDAAGGEVATDELLLNPGEYAFAISITEPHGGGRHTGSVEARAEVQVPEGSTLDRVEFWRDDQRVATLFQAPFTATIPLVNADLVVIRVVAFLGDGNQTEDIAILNAAGYLENVDVRMIEVFASVLDGQGRPLTELGRDAFRILENGVEQEILRFEHLVDLPIYAGLLVDTSASMAERMDAVRDAAVRFFEQAIRPQDRAAVVTFADRPRLVTGFTGDLDRLTGALAGIKAGEGTALYDSILFALYNFRGLKGQRALLVLSDGEDRRSKATFEEASEFALGSGVTLYTIGVEKGMTRRGKTELTRLAEETGGRAFLIDDVAELEGVYRIIQRDLRSKYFLAYQPGPSEDRTFRTVEVRVTRPEVEVRALRGYVPR